MKILLTCAALAAAATTFARPVLIHERAIIDPPDSTLTAFGHALAVDGDWALIGAVRDDGTPGLSFDALVLLYRRVNGTWTFQRVFASQHMTEANFVGTGVAMSNGLAAVSFSTVRVFRREGSTWIEEDSPFEGMLVGGNRITGLGLRLNGSVLAVAVGPCDISAPPTDWGALVAQRRADGTWTTPQRLGTGDFTCSEDPRTLEVSAQTLVLASLSNEPVFDPVRVFRNSNSRFDLVSTISGGRGDAGVRATEIFVRANRPNGTRVYRNDGSREVVDNLRTISGNHRDSAEAFEFVSNTQVTLQSQTDWDRGTVLNAFTKNTAGRYGHVGILVPVRESIAGPFAISGRRLLAHGFRNSVSSFPMVMEFELPETFAATSARQFTFESGSSAGWTPSSGAAFAVVASGANRVFRQSSLAGDAHAVLDGPVLRDQSIEADITPTAFSGADRWTGLAIRYADSSNYYYVTLRNSGVIQLRRLRNGAISTLNTATLEVVPGRQYRVHLQALGAQLSVHVDGRPVMFGTDSEIPSGRVALVGYRSRTDYDNVVVENIGQSTIIDVADGNDSCSESFPSYWTRSGGSWACGVTGREMFQQSLAGDARAVIGIPTDDQVVRVRARATAFDTGTGDPWFGVAVRYRNTANYYYVTLRRSGQLSLRKLVGGTITPLRSAPLVVTPGRWYELRLEAVGNQLRVYVDGALALQATDSSHATGVSGMVTYRTAAEYDSFLAYQP